MHRFLYGASVNGIQRFIYKTGRLKDIISNSEIVEEICTSAFIGIVTGTNQDDSEALSSFGTRIINAAGNIKFVFNSEEDCRRVVLEFPRAVEILAPGITVSQAVIRISANDSLPEKLNELELKLRSARNAPRPSITTGLIATKRDQLSGLPIMHTDSDSIPTDTNLNVSKKAFFPEVKYKDLCIDTKQMTKNNGWIAVIHADGNGIGQVVRKIAGDELLFKEFSKNLDLATKNAAQSACREVLEPIRSKEGRIPARAIIVGGDDFTVVCRGDIALEYASSYLVNFERQTRDLLGQMLVDKGIYDDGKLTACAGIAFAKESYPFYFSYKLAEDLCKEAKKRGTNHFPSQTPSSLMFHRIQDSFVSSFDDIAERELKLPDGYSFDNGPYTITGNEIFDSVDHLLELTMALNEGELKSKLRKYEGLAKCGDIGSRDKYLRRMKSISNINTGQIIDKLCCINEARGTYVLHDVLAINSIKNNSQEIDVL